MSKASDDRYLHDSDYDPDYYMTQEFWLWLFYKTQASDPDYVTGPRLQILNNLQASGFRPRLFYIIQALDPYYFFQNPGFRPWLFTPTFLQCFAYMFVFWFVIAQDVWLFVEHIFVWIFSYNTLKLDIDWYNHRTLFHFQHCWFRASEQASD